MDRPPGVPEWITVGAPLGSGAFGVVYEAFDHRQQVSVALKTLHEFAAEALTDLKHEFRIMADIVHPNLVTLYDLEVQGTSCIITMERIEGVALLAYLESHPGEPTLRDVFAQLAQAVSALHDAGILHRDLKPSNILVTAVGRVVVLDFGLALDRRRRSAGASAAGSLRYMAPEQLAGRAVCESSDWFSVGTILYEALGGRALLEGAPAELIQRRLRFDPLPGAVLVPGAPADLDALCRDLMRTTAAARPPGAAVARCFGGRAAIATETTRAEASLVGRGAELAALRDAFESVRQGRPTIVHLRGRSGMGKTRLVQEFLAATQRTEASALQFCGRCTEQESVPYKALDGMVDELAAHLRRLPETDRRGAMAADVAVLARLFPQLRDVTGARDEAGDGVDATPAQRRRAGAALRQLLARLAADRPVILVLDDLQWGDLDSIVLLEELFRSPAPALLLLGAYRTEDIDTSPFLKAFQRDPGAWGAQVERRDLELRELTAVQAHSLASALLAGGSADTAARAEAIARAASGNPLFVAELARTRAVATTTPVLLTLDDVIRARVADLPEAARRLLEVIAVSGQLLPLDVAQRAAALPGVRHPAFALLRRLHLARTRVQQGVGAVEALHDRIREAVVARLPSEIRRAHHAALAHAWERSGAADAETLAVHLAGGGDLGRAASLAAQAADAAARALAFDRAVRLYRWSLEIAQADDGERRARQARLAAALANAGRGAAAASTYLEAAVGAERVAAVELRRLAAEQYLISGHIGTGLATLRDVLAMVGMRLAATPRRALLSLLLLQARLWWRGLDFEPRNAAAMSADELLRIDTCWSVSIGLSLVDTARGAEFVVRHLLLALRAGEPYRVARALALQLGGSVVRGRGAARRTRELQARTWATARLAGHPHALALAAANSAAVLSFQGYFAESLARGREAEETLRDQCTGVRWERDAVEIFRLHSLNWMGRWRELGERIPSVLQDADDRNDRYLATYVRTRSAHIVHLAADRSALARSSQADGIDAWSEPPFQVQHYWDWLASIEIDLYEGRGVEAWNRIGANWRSLNRTLLAYVQPILIESRWWRARAALASAAVLAGSGARPRAVQALLAHAERDATRIEREGTAWGNALAGLARSAVAVGRGEVPRAVAHLAAAEAQCAATDMQQYASAARRRRGALLGGQAGAALIAEGDAWFATEAVRDRRRMVEMLLPGAWPQ